MKKLYGIIATIVIGLFLKTPLCCALDKEKPIETNSQSLCCLQLPIDSLPLQFQFPETPLACFGPYSQNTHFSNPLACFESCLPTSCFTSVLAYFDTHLPTSCSADTSSYFYISQDSNFVDPVKSSIEIRQGLWSVLWLYNNVNDLSPTRRTILAQYLNKSYTLCKRYDHPAKDLLLFVSHILISPQEKVQAIIQSFLTTFLQPPSKNLDMIEMKLSSVPFLSGRFLDKEEIMLLARQLIKAGRTTVAAQYLYTIGVGAMFIDGNYGDYKDYLLFAAEHNHTLSINLLARIN